MVAVGIVRSQFQCRDSLFEWTDSSQFQGVFPYLRATFFLSMNDDLVYLCRSDRSKKTRNEKWKKLFFGNNGSKLFGSKKILEYLPFALEILIALAL